MKSIKLWSKHKIFFFIFYITIIKYKTIYDPTGTQAIIYFIFIIYWIENYACSLKFI